MRQTLILLLNILAIFLPSLVPVISKPIDDSDLTHTGKTAFFLQDPIDGQCLGAQGFSICDESTVWILTSRVGSKNYSFVSLFSSSQKGLCLDLKKKKWFDPTVTVGLGSCTTKSSKNWNFQLLGSESIVLINGDRYITRGFPYHNSISVDTEDAVELRYQATSIHEAGFFIKSSDGLCFDGDYFRSCANPISMLWGVGVRYDRRGEAKRFIHNQRNRSICLESQGAKVYRGSCQSKYALGWSLSQGKLEFDSSGSFVKQFVPSTPQCVVRIDLDVSKNALPEAFVNATGAMRSCRDSSEYLLMELPSTFSSDDLRKILKEDTERLSKKEKESIEEMIAQMTVTGEGTDDSILPNPSEDDGRL